MGGEGVGEECPTTVPDRGRPSWPGITRVGVGLSRPSSPSPPGAPHALSREGRRARRPRPTRGRLDVQQQRRARQGRGLAVVGVAAHVEIAPDGQSYEWFAVGRSAASPR